MVAHGEAAPGAATGAGADGPKRGSLILKRMDYSALPGLVSALQTGLREDSADGKTTVSVQLKKDGSTDALSWLGLRNGDVLTRVNDAAVGSAEPIIEVVEQSATNAKLKFEVLRAGVLHTYVAKLEGERPAPQPPQPAQNEEQVFSAETLEHEWENVNPLDLVASFGLSFVQDDKKNMIGISSPRFEDFPLTNMLGLKNGDVITGINNIRLNGPEALVGLADKLQGQTSFAAQILRNGQPMTIRFRIQ
jgi:type II secretory pathway component PulC